MNNNNQLFHKWLSYQGKIDNPIVFLHGFLETHSIWYYLPLDKLKRPILLIDIPGFGKSNLFDDNLPSISYFSSEIIDLLASYKITNFDIVGHSMGGYVGLDILQQNPMTKKLVLLNSNFWEDPHNKKKERTRVADILLKSKNLFISEAIPNLFINPNKESKIIDQIVNEAKKGIAEWYAYATIAMRERKDFTNFYLENTEKIKIIHGEFDHLISLEVLREKSKNNPFEIIKDSGHMSLFEKPNEVIDTIITLLN